MSDTDTTDIEIRSFEVREVDPDDTEKREFVGIAVPYGEVVEVNGYREKFEKGVFGEKVNGPLFYGHDHRNGGTPIGSLVEARDTDDGLLIRARISKTPKGDEVYELLRDKTVQMLSVGFKPVESRMDDDVLVRTSAEFLEASVTPFAAYKTALVSEVRSATPNPQTEESEPMSDATVEDTSTDVADLRDTVTDIERRIAVLADERGDYAPVSQFRTGGEILKALASGDDKAIAEFRDFGTLADADGGTRPAWIARPLKFLEEKRRTIALFSKGPLPSSGNSVEFPFVASTTGTVGEQENEGDALTYMEVALDTGTSPVKTYGGYSSLSRQAIERSDLAYLDAVLRFQTLQYAKATETAALTNLLAVTGTGEVTMTGTGADAWIGTVIDAGAAIEDDSLGLAADFMVVSRDVFKSIATLMDTANRPLFALNGDGANTVGAANVVRAQFQIAGLRGVVDPTLPDGTVIVASAEAFTVLESPGAPFRLQDESIINLTKDFSLYGYLATTTNDAKGIVRVTLPA